MAGKPVTAKQVIIVFAVLFCIAAFVFLYPIFKYAGPSWPSINNPSDLLRECKSLLSEYPVRIEDANWPESVKNLSPAGVTGNKQFVDIRISGGGIGPGWDYLVYPNSGSNKLAPIDYIIRGSVYFVIYKYVAKQS